MPVSDLEFRYVENILSRAETGKQRKIVNGKKTETWLDIRQKKLTSGRGIYWLLINTELSQIHSAFLK